MTRTQRTMTTLMIAAVIAAPACADEDSPADDGLDEVASTGSPDDEGGGDETAASSTGAADDGDGGSTGGGIDVDELYDCVEPELLVVQPLAGPGIDPETGELLGPLRDEYVLHTTQIMTKPEQMDRFIELSIAVGEQLTQTEGFVGYSIAFDPTCGFQRTMGIWRDEQSMFAFVGSGVHAQAMALTTELSVTGRTTHWTASADEMPLTWEMALAEIDDVEPSPLY